MHVCSKCWTEGCVETLVSHCLMEFLYVRLKSVLLEMLLDSRILSILSSVLLLCQAEVQWSCAEYDRCHLLCSCRRHLPPPPPPPPPPPIIHIVDREFSVPLLEFWWIEMIVFGTIATALTLLLLLIVIICYKANKRRKTLKEKNEALRSHEIFHQKTDASCI